MFANAPNHNAIEPPDSTPPLSGKYRKSYITKTDALNFLLRALIPGGHHKSLDEQAKFGPKGGFLCFQAPSKDVMRVSGAPAFAARKGGIQYGQRFSTTKQKLHGPWVKARDITNHDLFNTTPHVHDQKDKMARTVYALTGAVILPMRKEVLEVIDFIKDEYTFNRVCCLMKANPPAIEILPTVRAIKRLTG